MAKPHPALNICSMKHCHGWNKSRGLVKHQVVYWANFFKWQMAPTFHLYDLQPRTCARETVFGKNQTMSHSWISRLPHKETAGESGTVFWTICYSYNKWDICGLICVCRAAYLCLMRVFLGCKLRNLTQTSILVWAKKRDNVRNLKAKSWET